MAQDTPLAGRPRRRLARAVDRRLEQIRTLDPAVLTDLLLAGVDRAATARWGAALERAEALPGTIRPQKLHALTRSMSRELAATGAIAGVAAAAPAVGTTATLATAAAEVAWFTTRAGDLILTIAALHGRAEPTVEERRAWVLAVLIYGGSAREGFTSVARQVGVEPVAGARLPWASLRAINGVLSSIIVRRYGRKRGAIAVGRAIPLGVGAIVGGGANHQAIRALARHADDFFARLPYSAVDTTAVEVTSGARR